MLRSSRVKAPLLALLAATGCTAWFGDRWPRTADGPVGASDLASPAIDLAGADTSLPPNVDLANADLANVDLAGGGLLTGSVATISGTIMLTAEGTSDWMHWGAAVDRKTGANLLSDYSLLPGTVVNHNNNSPLTYQWTDGTPATSATTNSDQFTTGAGHGFSFTAPADETTRTLKLYVVAWQATGQLVAHLSDSSAPDYTDRSLSAATRTPGVYTFVYHSAGPGQTLRVTWSMQANLNNGEVELGATTLH